MAITRIGTYAQIKGSSYKLPCVVATTASITLSGTQTIDGVAVVVGDRVLVKNQGDATNGIYIVASGAWSRAVDMSLDDDVYQGLQVYINSGTVNAGKSFYLSTPNPISIGVTSISFTQSSGGSGTSGTSGTNGTSGINGTNGTSGSNGTSGVSGTSGINGTSGSNGSNGTSGSNGSNGTSGTDGTNGTSGSNGSNGTSGTDGTSGINGTSGTSGVNGTSGTDGAAGSNGTSGSNGSNGTSGTDGTSGTSGVNGTSGTDGAAGTNGTSGSSGVSGAVAIGGTVTGGTTGSVLFIDPTATLAQDNANFFWDNSLNLLGIGTATPSSPIEVYSTSTTYRGIAVTQASSDTVAAVFTGRKIRGTSAVANGDFLFNFNAQGYDGSAYQSGSVIRWQVDGTVSAGSVPTAIEFRTGSSGTGTQRLLISSTGVSTFSGQVISTLAGSTTTGGGQLYLNGATSNRIDFNTNGVAAPAFTTRSAGTKLVLFPAVTASAVDYALGIEASTMWFSVPDTATSNIFKWYAGTTNILTLTGAGAMTLSRNQDGATYYTISNVQTGTASEVYLQLTSYSTAGSAYFGKYSATKPTNKIILAKDSYWLNNSIGGDIAILNDYATGSIKLAAGGSSTAHMTIASTGITTFADNLVVSKNQNALTNLEVSNTTSGTASKVQTLYTSDATAGTAIIGKNSNTFTTAGILNLADMFLVNNTKGDIAILNNFASGAIKVAAGASPTSQLTLKTTGQLQLNGYTSTSAFTGTVAGYLGFDSSGNILSSAAPATGNGYTLQFTAQALANFTWADGTLYYIGNGVPMAQFSNQGRAEVYVPKAGTITAAYVYASFSTAGSNQSWSMSILINGTTATTIQSISVGTATRTWSNTALSIAVAVGDHVEIRSDLVTWTTNPVSNTGYGVNATIYIE